MRIRKKKGVRRLRNQNQQEIRVPRRLASQICPSSPRRKTLFQTKNNALTCAKKRNPPNDPTARRPQRPRTRPIPPPKRSAAAAAPQSRPKRPLRAMNAATATLCAYSAKRKNAGPKRKRPNASASRKCGPEAGPNAARSAAFSAATPPPRPCSPAVRSQRPHRIPCCKHPGTTDGLASSKSRKLNRRKI